MTGDVADRLRFHPIVADELNTAPHRTPFLVPIDHRDAGTGVSPRARALTIRALADPESRADDFLRPGHISPLRAKEGGVLRRAGHTEATVDLVRMAGLAPGGRAHRNLQPRRRGDGRLRGTSLDRLRIRRADRQHRRPDPLPPQPRTARPPGGRRHDSDEGLRQPAGGGLPRRSRGARAGRARVGRFRTRDQSAARGGCTLPASPATCSTAYAATAATNCTSRCVRSTPRAAARLFTYPRKAAASA